MQDLYDMFSAIREKPMAKLGGRESIYDLQAFYLGYTSARREMGLPITEQERDFSLFEAWLTEQYKITTMMPWGHIICFRSLNEHRALTKFFELLEEFKCRNDSDSKPHGTFD
jgi:hypothetical protein